MFFADHAADFTSIQGFDTAYSADGKRMEHDHADHALEKNGLHSVHLHPFSPGVRLCRLDFELG